MNNIIRAKMLTKTTKLQLIQGDITEEKVNAIVNAANTKLQHGGGVAGAGAISRKGGPIIQEESNKIGFVKTGSCAITKAGNLTCNYIIHAVGPVWGDGDEERKLKNAIYSSLALASENQFISISFPAISSGIYGYPKNENAIAILTAIKDFVNENKTSLNAIRICIIDDETLNYFIDNFELV
ncbi:MAG: macro domain-containing protein [Calditrichia bacterium]|nr:macro domain-containing protein [Calditrichia bacterium]